MATLTVQLRNAYRAGWNASALVDGPTLEPAEDTYLARGRTDAQHDAWLDGWTDYATEQDHRYPTTR